jgi:hypothetical protein
MTSAAAATLYRDYKRFVVSRVKAWKPKIHANLKQMILNATDEPTIERAISRLDENMLEPSGLSITLQKVYTDAGRVWGGKIYQVVKKEAAGYKPRATKKMLTVHGSLRSKRIMPGLYNEELAAEVIAYFRLHDLEMVSEISDTMKEWILEKLIEGQQQGLSIQEVANNMINDDVLATRAITIARTETVKAANVGAMQGAKKSGFQTEKEWIAARDIRTRRIPRDEFSHVIMSGKTAAMEEPFLVPNRNGSNDSLMQPCDPKGDAGDVINCRCTVGFNVIRGANGLPVRS